MDTKENETFNYTYSAKEQAEIQNIRKKYATPEKQESKMEQLRRLDERVTKKAVTYSLTVGIIGALILGIGMSLAMTDIGASLGSMFSMAVGIVVGIIGLVLVCLAHPVYTHTLKKEREKIAPEILRLTDELMK